MFAQRHRRWPSITSALGQCISLSGWWLFWRLEEENVTRICGSTCCRYLVYSRPSVGVVLGQCCRRFVGIESAMGCDAGPKLMIWWVGLHRMYEVGLTSKDMLEHDSLASIEWMLASTGDGGRGNKRWRYILIVQLGSTLNYILNI